MSLSRPTVAAAAVDNLRLAAMHAPPPARGGRPRGALRSGLAALVGACTCGVRQAATNPATPEQVSGYLHANPEFLEHYVMEEVDLEQLERWMIRRTQRSKKMAQPLGRNGRKTSLSRWKFCVHADKTQMLRELTQSLRVCPTKDHVLWELSNCINSAVGADGFNLYIYDKNLNSLGLYMGEEVRNEDGSPQLQHIKSENTVAGYVAKCRETVRASRHNADIRFSDGPPFKGDGSHVLCQPIIQTDGELAAILELWRRDAGGQFHEEDEEITVSYLVWGGIALHYAQLYLNMTKQRNLNDFLLTVVKSIFQDMVSMDTLVIKVMNFAQRLVDADRASLFLVDSKNKELYATIFDIGLDTSTTQPSGTESGSEDSSSKNRDKEIRFSLGTGIAGHVALTGEILNIKDAYADPRFNRTVDQLTGYKTNTILCMPIYIRGNVIGVVQMVNKHSGYFTTEDEVAFEMFAVYCGLALHHAKLYDKIRRSEQKYKVSLEVLSYHNTCSHPEVLETSREVKDPPRMSAVLDDYYFNAFDLDDKDKVNHAIFMFTDLFGTQKFDKNALIRFTLTVKKNYRMVPYHNWTHGFAVANCMFAVIKHSGKTFTPNEQLALFVGSLCHDLDHRGKNNKFMSDIESPLAAIYSTSTMEHHHFNQTVTILQQEGHNIFSLLSNHDYKQVLGLLKHCILATDLAMFFPNKAKLTQLIKDRKFNWSNPDHRLLLQAIAMTSSDLSASAKPWDVQVETVKVIFEEFYQQGDAERSAGRTPIPMMDRYQPEQQAASQVGFLTGICIPCYTILHKLIPETEPLLNMCSCNLELWKKVDEEKGVIVTNTRRRASSDDEDGPSQSSFKDVHVNNALEALYAKEESSDDEEG